MSCDLGVPITEEGDFYFISYNSEDAEQIASIVREMHDYGVPVWYDNGIDYGDLWEEVIATHIYASKAVILFFTAGILEKEESYVSIEYEMAKKYYGKKIYAVFMDEIDPGAVPPKYVRWTIELERLQNLHQVKFDDKQIFINEILKMVSGDTALKLNSAITYFATRKTHSNYKDLLRRKHIAMACFGRKKYMSDIKQALETDRICALTGRPGFGKSSIAFRYAADHKKEYGDVLVISCENTANIKNSAHILQCRNDELSEALYDYILRNKELCGSQKLLVVFDNIGKDKGEKLSIGNTLTQEIVDVIGEILEEDEDEQKIHIITTSTRQELLKEYEKAVGEFDSDDAKDFLRDEIDFSDYEDKDLDEILDSFGRIPITLKTIKTIAKKKKSYKKICVKDLAGGVPDMKGLVKDLLDGIDEQYQAAVKIMGYCHKDNVPGDFLERAVWHLLNCPNAEKGSIINAISWQNNLSQLFDYYYDNEKDKWYFSMHQTYQSATGALYEAEADGIKKAVFDTYRDTLDFTSYYSGREFLAVGELQNHIEAFWESLTLDEKRSAQELWIHYRWISEYYLCADKKFEASEFHMLDSYSLRLEGDRLTNALEDGDADEENLKEYIEGLCSEESREIINSDLIVRTRVSIFLLELYLQNEADYALKEFEGQQVLDYVKDTLHLVDKESEKKNCRYQVFFFEHRCMMRSMFSIEERGNSSKQSCIAAVMYNDEVLNLCKTEEKNLHSGLGDYDFGFLKKFALNLRTVPQWEKPAYFADPESGRTEIRILEDALRATEECLDWYEKIQFYERTETELGNLFQICGRLSKLYLGKDKDQYEKYRSLCETYLKRRYEERKQSGYPSSEFLCSYNYNRYLFYTQFTDQNSMTREELQALYLKTKDVLEAWEKAAQLDTHHNDLFLYRMKGVFFRKKIEKNLCDTEEEKKAALESAIECFDKAIALYEGDISIKIINTVEYAYALKAYGLISEAVSKLEEVEEDVERTGAWKNIYNLACERCLKAKEEQKKTL